MRKKWPRYLVLMLVFALVATACGDGDSDTTATDAGVDTTAAAPGDAAAPSGDAIRLGMLIGVTGDYSPWYDPSKAGADVAIDEINAAGGVLGRPVELVVVDNQSTVEGAVQGFSQAVDIEAIDALGGVESDGAVANLQTIKEIQLPTICPACGTSELDQAGGDYIFRITGSDTDGGIIAAQFARDAGFTRVAMLVQDTEGASAPADVFKEVFTTLAGGEVIADVRFSPGEASYQAQVDQAFEGDPDIVYLGAGFEAGGIILQEWQRRGYGGNWLFSPDLIVPEIAALVDQGIEIGDGVARAAIPSYDTASAAYAAYAPRYEAITGEPPSPGLYDANQYDQYIVLALAMTAAGSTDGPAVAGEIANVLNPPGTAVFTYAEGLAALEAGDDIDFHGASSSLDVNSFGNLASPTFGEQQLVDGEWTQVGEVTLDPVLRP